MIKHVKLIFYITSAVILGLATIWQIYSVRGVLTTVDSKQLDAELSQVQDVVRLWKKRQPFSMSGAPATPSANKEDLIEEQTPSPSDTQEATASAEN